MVEKEQRKVWFKAKNLGWGWYPCAWQGWLILLVWVLIFVEFFFIVDKDSHSVSDTLTGMLVPAILLLALIILIGFGIGEKPRWRWSLEKR